MTLTSPTVRAQVSIEPLPSTNVCEKLRHATHAAHVRINRHPYLSGLIKVGYPLAQYQTLLTIYAAIYAPIEAQVESFIACNDVPFEYCNRRKTDWLRNDMAYFGLNLPEPPWQPPVLPALMPLADRGALIGTLYVIEGATLGGEVISRHLQNNLDLGPTSGARFFNGYGGAVATRRNWQTFCDFANSIATSTILQASAKLSAVHVFELIEHRLDALYA